MPSTTTQRAVALAACLALTAAALIAARSSPPMAWATCVLVAAASVSAAGPVRRGSPGVPVALWRTIAVALTVAAVAGLVVVGVVALIYTGYCEDSCSQSPSPTLNILVAVGCMAASAVVITIGVYAWQRLGLAHARDRLDAAALRWLSAPTVFAVLAAVLMQPAFAG